MARAFKWVAISHIGLLLAVTVMGLQGAAARRETSPPASTSLSPVPAGQPPQEVRAGLSRHIVLAVFTLLLACLVHTVVFTYFTVTGKLIQQALSLGGFDVIAGMQPVKQRKARVSRLVGLSVLPVVLAVGTGAWVIEAVPQQRWHLPAAMLMTITHVLVYPKYYRAIDDNGRHLDETMAAYQAARTGRTASRPAGS